MVSEINTDLMPFLDPNRWELTPPQQQILDQTIQLFPSFNKLGLGRTNLISHKIDVADAPPVKQRHYAVSPAVQKEMYEEIDRMLALGVIEESCSPWCSPMALVRKSNGKARLCLDARKLNELTKKDAYPLPLIDGLLSRQHVKTSFISSLDLKDAFWQVPLDPASKEYTAFTVPGRPLYHFNVMPFGLCNSPQSMCRLMHRAISHELHERVFVYLDDLLITSETFEEHVRLLSEVAEILPETSRLPWVCYRRRLFEGESKQSASHSGLSHSKNSTANQKIHWNNWVV